MTTTTIINARIFDGEQVLDETSLVIDGRRITAIGGRHLADSTVIDATGGTLLPGLIDSHVHTSMDGLRDALRFGVTTELEMQGYWTADERVDVAHDDGIADVRSAGFGLTTPGGHPSELFPADGPPPGVDISEGAEHDHGVEPPEISTPEEAIKLVASLVEGGSDYIKIMIEEGTVLGSPGLPVLSDDTIVTAVREAHRHGKLAVAHVLTVDSTAQAIAAGMDGLAHLFCDRPHTPQIIDAIAASGAFVVPCLVLNSSILGRTGEALAADERVGPKLSDDWLSTLCSCFNTYPQGNFDDVLATVTALHTAGVEILVGTDVSVPFPFLGGLAHGASVHHELQLLVQAGLTPVEALRAATSAPARRFGLTDRGHIAVGARADLVLVDGDPTTDITTTLSIREIWRRGRQLPSA